MSKSTTIINTQPTTNNNEEVDTLSFFNTLTTKSSQIRFLDSIGYTRSNIVKFMNKHSQHKKIDQHILYQHVRNVLITPIK